MTTRTTPPLPSEVRASLARLVDLVNHQSAALQGLPHSALTDWLYAQWYTTPAATFAHSDLQAPAQDLQTLLRAALEHPRHWESGWVALEVAAGQRVLAGRGPQRRLLIPGDFANLARPGVPVAPGDGLATWGLLSWRDPPTGFLGLRPCRAEPAGPLVRVYFSVGLPALPRVMREVVLVLETLGQPWSLKCPGQPADYGRVDSLVVYLQQADWAIAKAALTTLATRLAPHLRCATPPLTRPMGRGVAWAIDPSNHQSFGQSRAAALAVAVSTWLQSGQDVPLHRSALVAALATAGIDPAQPWSCPAPAATPENTA